MNCDVSNFHWYLKSDESRETGLSTVEVKCDELSIHGLHCPQGIK
jgi:hypothetical protein